MTKSDGSNQTYSQDCSICLNSIAVCSPLPSLSRNVLTIVAQIALPVPLRGALLTHLALQMHSSPAAGSELSDFHLSKLSRSCRFGG